MDAADRLLAIEEIKQVKARYFRLMDQKDWAAMANVFTDDIVCNFNGALRDPGDGGEAPADDPYEQTLNGRDTVMSFISTGLAHARSIHHGHMPEVTIEDDENASAITAMFDSLTFSEGPLRSLEGYGHYYETYRKVDGRWRIATLKLVRLRVDTVAA